MKLMLTVSVFYVLMMENGVLGGTTNTGLAKENQAMKERIENFCLSSGWTKQSGVATSFSPVAFTAILSHDVSLGQKQVIVYDRVLTNIGGAYNHLNGYFKAPYDGLYSISVSMMGDYSNGIHLNLMQNTTELVRLWTQEKHSDLSSQTINIYLRKSDQVCVRQQSGSKLYGRENFNVFSAVLLRHGQF